MGGVSIAAGEVHAHCEVDLAAAHDVIEKRVHPTDLESMQYVIRNVCVCIPWYYGVQAAWHN